MNDLAELKIVRLLTGISKTFGCSPNGKFREIEPPRSWLKPSEQGLQIHPKELSWLDQLLEGGFVLPIAERNDKAEASNRALTVLLTGGAGTGKSSLALELCWRWTQLFQPSLNQGGLSSLYLTSETNAAWALQKAKDMGWSMGPGEPERIFVPGYAKNNPDAIRNPNYIVRIATNHLLQNFLKENINKSITQPLEFLSHALAAKLGLSVEDFRDIVHELPTKYNISMVRDAIKKEKFDVLVVDSLNSIASERERDLLFERFSQLANSNLKLIIIILESDSGKDDYWKYLVDVVLRLDVKTVGEYLTRNIEVVKARYQAHAWGTHQLKFCAKGKSFEDLQKEIDKQAEIITEKSEEKRSKEEILFDLQSKLVAERRRAHPYREIGGVFIYPSIPYHLSLYKRHAPDPEKIKHRYSTSIIELDDILMGKGIQDETGGFPRGRCTGFVGKRGGHKSHLAYLTILNHISNKQEQNAALVVSLRDDEEMARRTMEKILSTELDKTPNRICNLSDLEKNDKLEIMFFPPGHIRPEEFYHRIFVSIHRLRCKHDNVFLLFNSLDQLSSRFPLCAREQTFIPGIIETLMAECVSSIFIGVEEEGQPEQQYGLLSMADALITFQRWRIGRQDVLSHMKAAVDYYSEYRIGTHSESSSPQKAFEFFAKEAPKYFPAHPNPVVIDITRFSGGQAAQIGGMLELVDKENLPQCNKFHSVGKAVYGKEEGLCFIPFNKEIRRRSDPPIELSNQPIQVKIVE